MRAVVHVSIEYMVCVFVAVWRLIGVCVSLYHRNTLTYAIYASYCKLRTMLDDDVAMTSRDSLVHPRANLAFVPPL